ncbi:hypothetical protein JCM16303_002549 [Sporobolomyces ruberrimus]
MFRPSTNAQALATPRSAGTIDLTFSSDEDEDDSLVKPRKSFKPRRPVIDSDSDDSDSELEILQGNSTGTRSDTKDPRRVNREQDSEEESLPESGPSRGPSNGSRTRDESESVGSSDEEEQDTGKRTAEADESIVVASEQPKLDPRPRPAASGALSMSDALASMSFRKKPSASPPPQLDTRTNLDPAQANALRKQGFLSSSSSVSNQRPQPTNSRQFYPSHSSKPAPTFPKPNLPLPSITNRVPQPSSSSGFASSLNAFNLKPQPISVKERIGAQVQRENTARGIPIAVPTNPPLAVVCREGKIAAAKGFDVDAELEGFGQMEIRDGAKEEEAVAAFRKGLGATNVEVDEDELDQTPPPPHLVCTLLPHQVDSLRWLKSRESGKGENHGGLLADDMGLGKTVQMLALILSHPLSPEDDDDKYSKTTLIVAPVGLLGQWKLEIENKTNKRLRVVVYHGAKRKQHVKTLHNYDVVVTNYETVSSDKASESGLFEPKRRQFHRVILDEAHTIKNYKTKKAEACSAVKAHYRWALTGTPIQNSVDDLFSIFKFLGKRVVPRSLWNKSDFDDWIGKPIKKKENKVAFERLSSVLDEIMKRRTKATTVNGKPILPLPARIVTVVRSNFLDPDEESFYKAIEEKMVLQYNKFLKGSSSGSEYAQVLVRLLRMRQATLHPALVTKASIETDADAIDPQLKNDAENKSPEKIQGGGLTASCIVCGQAVRPSEGDYCSTCATDFDRVRRLQSSTKVSKTMQLLEQFRKESKGLDAKGEKIPKKKVIIFSQFTSMFPILEKFLKAGGYGFVRFDGSCSMDQKDAAIEKITNDANTTVILISIMAGAVGLNLTMCSRVILLDLWWNPAIESQAFDRAHRYGQKEDVQIYKLVIDGTVEERILTLQAQKADLAASALDGGSATKAKLTQKERDFLFRGHIPSAQKKKIQA